MIIIIINNAVLNTAIKLCLILIATVDFFSQQTFPYPYVTGVPLT